MEQDNKSNHWYHLIAGDTENVKSSEIHITPVLRHFFGMLPAEPRCKYCNSPFSGFAGKMLAPFGYKPSNMSTSLCMNCEYKAKEEGGGGELDISMLFADIRGSTTLAEGMRPGEFSKHIQRFYAESTKVLVRSDALIDKLIGDEVAAFYPPGFAGKDHPKKAIQAAIDLLKVTGHEDPDGPWLPVGVGLNYGEAYVGVVGAKEGLKDLTILGDSVNTTARLASLAGPGEILVSESISNEANYPTENLEKRELKLKGKSEAINVSVIKINA
ncbi:MAG: adenylate/guanylate cyclase domain-containing protein [Chloroflexi bacterium]|jgi:adenylate cyclase|nr:adenylate/guanylate cyclase domain-containing protein [Chloroflexota bacterium]MBT4004297.1 adenylate/guanylate cyclase domain-containing protein [Chloroflexota bacterium]MBT4305706.1 adenylate/guanylate cyclase domain-containing protein [Chloroflexota bacterium]MBT4533530.1 adenylate/guanylate cyclase domain-containing protein [Chloroflexota bacterium]MBT4681827.1 adenylate/guanylate cyclase domain-containing protein [Chloroflexota bacterium]